MNKKSFVGQVLEKGVITVLTVLIIGFFVAILIGIFYEYIIFYYDNNSSEYSNAPLEISVYDKDGNEIEYMKGIYTIDNSSSNRIYITDEKTKQHIQICGMSTVVIKEISKDAVE